MQELSQKISANLYASFLFQRNHFFQDTPCCDRLPHVAYTLGAVKFEWPENQWSMKFIASIWYKGIYRQKVTRVQCSFH
jgi:hypothetical protein